MRQNFSGTEVFLSASDGNEKFSIFEAIDEFSESLNHERSSGTSSNLLSEGQSVGLILPASGAAAQYKFDLSVDGQTYKIDSNVYGNDFSGLVAELNSYTSSTGVTATITSGNQITLYGTPTELKISNFSTDLPNTPTVSNFSDVFNAPFLEINP